MNAFASVCFRLVDFRFDGCLRCIILICRIPKCGIAVVVATCAGISGSPAKFRLKPPDGINVGKCPLELKIKLFLQFLFKCIKQCVATSGLFRKLIEKCIFFRKKIKLKIDKSIEYQTDAIARLFVSSCAPFGSITIMSISM